MAEFQPAFNQLPYGVAWCMASVAGVTPGVTPSVGFGVTPTLLTAAAVRTQGRRGEHFQAAVLAGHKIWFRSVPGRCTAVRT